MKQVWRRLSAVALAGALATQSMGAFAQSATDREQELLQMIQSLKERVDQLEQKAGNLEDMAVESANVSIRQSTLEAKVDGMAESGGGELGPKQFDVHWSSGLRLNSGDGNFKLKIGGRIQNDWAWYDDDSSLWPIAGGDIEDGTEFRRARLYMEGSIYGNINYKAQYDFETGDSDFKDVWMELADIPVIGKLRVGHFKEPFSLEELTSSKYTTFMERALPNAFAPSRNTGAMIHNTAFNDRLTWAAGIFRETDDYGDGMDDGGYNVTARVAGTPWYAEEGRKMLHLGAAYSHRNVDGALRYRQRPESHDTGRYIDTGAFAVDDVDLFNLEAALVYGPFSVQGEYFYSDVDSMPVGFFGHREDPNFDGWYLFASWFLTGENRPYKQSAGAFDRVKPNNNFKLGEGGGWGAWELALRYSTLDFEDGGNRWWDLGGIYGGEEDNITVGLNWYLNPNTRVMLNYINADIDRDFMGGNTWFPVSRGGDLEIFQTRFQVDF